jgi:alkylation response protein AidB-like acyl-CoA dehydrogenase
MDLSYGPRYEDFRAEVKSFLADNADRAPRMTMRVVEHSQEVVDWQKRLIEAGYAARTIPREYGGYGADPDLLETMIIAEEFSAARVSQGAAGQGISMLVPTLLEYGSEEQKRRYVPPTVNAELLWCQGYSEPGSGSDLASLSTRAELDGDQWVINGHKIWTSTAVEAGMMFILVRTEPEASKHRGISYLLVDMDTPGIEIRPLRMMTGSSDFNEVFLEDVRVPRENLVGERGQGWQIGKTTLVHERNFLGSSALTEGMLAACRKTLAAATDEQGGGNLVHGDRLMQLEGRALAMKYHGLRMLTDRLKGRNPGAAGLITKLNGCQLNNDICSLAIDGLADYGILYRGSPHAVDDGAWQKQYMFQLGMIIGGGTAQIQKNIISERGLGMPREPRATAGS